MAMTDQIIEANRISSLHLLAHNFQSNHNILSKGCNCPVAESASLIFSSLLVTIEGAAGNYGVNLPGHPFMPGHDDFSFLYVRFQPPRNN